MVRSSAKYGKVSCKIKFDWKARNETNSPIYEIRDQEFSSSAHPLSGELVRAATGQELGAEGSTSNTTPREKIKYLIKGEKSRGRSPCIGVIENSK